MPIKASCPKCQASYNLADRQLGKKVRCKSCESIFVAADDGDQPTTRTLRTPSAQGSNGISASASPSVRARYDDEEEDDRPSRSRRVDDEDDDDRPRRSDNERAAPRKSGGSKKGLIIGGIIAFVLLAGGGVTAVILLNKNGDKINSVSDALTGLKAKDVETRREAARWLAENQSDLNRWPEVQKAIIETAFTDPDTTTQEQLTLASQKWAEAAIDQQFGGTRIRDQVNVGFPGPDFGKPGQDFGRPPPEPDVKTLTVEQLLDKAKDASPQNRSRMAAIEELGRRQEPRAARLIVPLLADFFNGDPAATALRNIGQPAEKEVLTYLNHPDGSAHGRARDLLRGYGTNADTLLAQTLSDLGDADNNRRRVALDWLQKEKPAAGQRQADLSRTLEKLLNDPDYTMHFHAMKALDIYATQESVPAIATALDASRESKKPFQEDFQKACMQTIGRFKDARGAEAVAQFLSHRLINATAEKALSDIGAAAQAEVLKHFNHRDNQVHMRARKLIQAYGTKDAAIIDQVMLDLREKEAGRRSAAARWLAEAKVNEEKHMAVARALDDALKAPDDNAQNEAMNALKTWATVDNVQSLVALVESKEVNRHSHSMCRRAMQVLGALKDERGIIPVVGRLRDNGFRRDAVTAVKAFGQPAEPIVLNLLVNGDTPTQIECCHILKEIGTKQSTPLLKQFEKQHRDIGVRKAAGDAMQVIQAKPATP